MGIASLILGIVSLVMMFLVIVAKISFGSIPTICAIVGIVLGIMQNKKEKDQKATIGIALCLIYIAIFIIIVVRSVIMMKSMLP